MHTYIGEHAIFSEVPSSFCGRFGGVLAMKVLRSYCFYPLFSHTLHTRKAFFGGSPRMQLQKGQLKNCACDWLSILISVFSQSGLLDHSHTCSAKELITKAKIRQMRGSLEKYYTL